MSSPNAAPSPVRNEITIVSHSTLFYWWPVWAVGLLLGILSFFSGYRMALVPAETKAYEHAEITAQVAQGQRTTFSGREVLVAPENGKIRPREVPTDDNSQPANPRLHTSSGRGFGVLFATVLLLVIVITNVPLRGMWSVVVIILVILLSIIFALAGWWEQILFHLSLLDIRINAGGYFFISGVLFTIWLITMIFFDRQIYMIFTPGQLKVCTEIGGGEKVYDAFGMTLEKQRSDLFRHWILGLGSGDLIVKTSGAQAHHFDLPNVLFIGKKVQEIEDMLKKKAVVETR
jgi:hypothetical protein